MTTAVSIPDPVFQSADRLARPLRVSLSELLRASLDDVAQSARLSPSVSDHLPPDRCSG